MRHSFLFLEVFSAEGGIQSYIQDVLAAYEKAVDWTKTQADVFLLRDGADCNFPEGHLTFHTFAGGSPTVGRLKLAAAFAQYLLLKRPDHVYCGHINLAPLVSQLCGLLKIPFTILTYGKEVWYELPAGQKTAFQKADSLWTISRYSRDLACKANDVPLDRFEMLPCVVNGDVFTPGGRSPELVTRYQLADTQVLMTVARLWSGDIYKGVDVTIRALPKILQQVPAVKYVVIGRGDDQPRLAKLAEELGVADRVVFAGFVPDEDLIAHYRLADVYVMPSKEGFGIVYLEAMACGVPVIGGDDDGSADPLQDGKVGWQVPHRDPEAVAVACVEALSADDPRRDGDWLRSQTLAKFSAPALTERVGELVGAY